MNDTLLPAAVLDSLADTSDDAGDAVIERLASEVARARKDSTLNKPTARYGQRRDAFPDLLRAIADEPGDVKSFLGEGQELDAHIDPQLIRRAQSFFEVHGVAVVTALFHAALPEAYLGRRGAQVLDLTGELVSNWRRRIMETGQFLVSVLSPSAELEGSNTSLSHGQFGARVVRRVRLRHAAVRWLLRARYDPSYASLLTQGLVDARLWDARMQEVGEDRVPTEPLNQEDLLATLGTFTTVTSEALAKLGTAFDDEDRRAFYHLWNVVGWHLGIGDTTSLSGVSTGARGGRWPRNAILPLDPDDMDALFGRLRQRLQHRNDAGVRLATTLVQELSYPLPRPFQGAPAFFIRYLVGDDKADQLGVGAGRYFELFVRRTGALETIARRTRVNPFGEQTMSLLSRTVTRYALRNFVAESRGGDGGFSIDPRIANQWGVQMGPELRAPSPA
jgi:hypothetical protein